MAHRLSAAVALILVSSLLSCGVNGATRVTSLSEAAAIRSATRAASHALALFYEAANAGARDAYIFRARARRLPTSFYERCRLPSGALSTRPTVLANPLLARASILQRERLAATIGAYEALLVATSQDVPTSEIAVAVLDLKKELIGLDAASNMHARGDLFIEDAVRALAHESARFARGDDREERLGAIMRVDPIVKKLLEILASDAGRQRVDAVDAAALAYRESMSGEQLANDPPFCSEPAIYARGMANADGASDPSSALPRPIDERIAHAKKRLDAVRSADPAAFIAALTALDADALRMLKLVKASDADDMASTSIERFKTTVSEFTRALQPIDSNAH